MEAIAGCWADERGVLGVLLSGPPLDAEWRLGQGVWKEGRGEAIRDGARCLTPAGGVRLIEGDRKSSRVPMRSFHRCHSLFSPLHLN